MTGALQVLAAAALILVLFNSALTALYVETLIRPILSLNETMKRAGRGDLSVRALIRRGDEVAQCHPDGRVTRTRVSGLFAFDGTRRVEVEQARSMALYAAISNRYRDGLTHALHCDFFWQCRHPSCPITTLFISMLVRMAATEQTVTGSR